jgi:hypothetical protein
MKPTLKQCGKHSDSLVPTGKKRGSSQQKSAIGKTENSSLNCRGPLSTGRKFSADFERNWDHALFSIFPELSTSGQAGIMWENHPVIGVKVTLYH